MPAKTVSQGSAAPAITAAPAAKAIAAVSLRRPGSARIISTGSYLKNRSERWVDPAPFRPGPPRRHSAGSAWTLRAHPGPSTWKNRKVLVGTSGVQSPAAWQACTAVSLFVATILFQAGRFFTPTTTTGHQAD